jgi:uncharacterized repeat protein (TIGR03803 family)
MGNFYGTTSAGGADGYGTVFEITEVLNGPPAETLLYSFAGGIDGGGPNGNLVFDRAGNLYGVTGEGGDSPNCTSGCGTVFELSPPAAPGGVWAKTTLYSFQGSPSDGEAPQGGLAIDQAGNLYGAAGGGNATCNFGNSRCGVVFELIPPAVEGGPWTETVLHSFGGPPDGGVAFTPVIVDQAGKLYGTTQYGGMWNQGAAFEVSPLGDGTWSETVIHSFEGEQGIFPEAGLAFGPGGALFGTTCSGGKEDDGSVFQLTPPSGPGAQWVLVLLYSFGRAPGDGICPIAGVTFGGPNTLYGTTASYGTVFRLSKTGHGVVETVLYTFTGGKDGGYPFAGVTLYNGALYGTTLIGGYQNNGVIFKLSP